ncbi:MAG: CPBP family intramembrane metalloprotease [Propionibacteriaceae bacterium]|nr:CPBP family intramembrane metalloprotease [Propionibacteriaceae bacterium]
MRISSYWVDPDLKLRSTDLLPPDQPAKPWPSPHPARYNALTRLLAFVGVLVAVLVVEASIFFAATTQDLIDAPYWLTELALITACLAAYLVTGLLTEQRLDLIELAPRRIGGLARGLAFGLVAVAVCLGLLALFGSYRVVGLNHDYSPWLDLMTLGLGAAVTEEIVFRGLAFRLLEDVLGSWAAVALTATAFGLLHVANPEGTWQGGVAITIEAGLLFAAIYIVSRSLWWVIGFHLAWNVAQGPLFGSVVSGSGRSQSWLVAEMPGPDWLSGGAFGLEASIVPVLLLGGLAVWLLALAGRRGLMVAPWWVRRRRLWTAGPTTGD